VDLREAGVALDLLAGSAPPRAVRPSELRTWVAERAGVPDWLADVCAATAGSAAEALALLLPAPADGSAGPLLEDVLRTAGSLVGAGADPRREIVLNLLAQLQPPEREAALRILTGTLKPYRHRRALFRAAGAALGTGAEVLAWRTTGDGAGPPYPFAEASAAATAHGHAADPDGEIVQFVPAGLRCQVVRREPGAALWSSAFELVSRRYPELHAAARGLPTGTVLDGMVTGGGPAAMFTVLDVLEVEGMDIRQAPLAARLGRLSGVLAEGALRFRLGEARRALQGGAHDALREEARRAGMAGILVRAATSGYSWNLLPPAPHILDLLLLDVDGLRLTLASPGATGPVPVVRVDAVPDPEEAAHLQAFVRSHTVERFGPVRRVEPLLLYRVACDAVRPSPRRKSGVVLDHPVLICRLRDADPSSAVPLEEVRRRSAGSPPAHTSG
jgi:DNA ligase-1